MDDMTLQELIGYIDATEGSNNNLQRLTHDFFASHTDQMAEGLREFVQENYPLTFQEIGSSLEPYRAMALKGTSDSYYWQQEVTAKGKETEYMTQWSKFISAKKFDCYK
ncbi:hypothetical protein [Rufibacter sp. XAAS-G3-1]|uniref:hypothetical protein n=1 Tax=Rufibacter sp. XAAS-G3-1 TaxID=2729134 RepID=UPI0015E75AAE|nr:hypothetical protein [Rufibacter sp. XAAS-G3-1]